MIKRQIVAMGGGGFLMSGDFDRMDAYVLSLARKRRPRVCFVPTAGGDKTDNIAKFHEAFTGARAEASHLRLFGVPRTDIRDFVLSQDVIYVGGGNTANMLAVWRVHGVDRLLREAWRRGIVLTGVSAGMLCWYEGGVTDSFGRPLSAIHDGLGLLKGSACPHYDGETDRRPIYHALLRKSLPGGVAADDWAAIHYIGRKVHACVAAKAGAKCYRVRVRGRDIHEVELATRLLT
ncbi:MAG TPA: peptidase E [Phycisphaerae bacterium]|nr:peptidase E [Phycisphaerae bacterium]HRW51782.1 peptidase E [Phycisphaerae bacterium]